MSSEVRFGSAIDITMFAQQFLCRLSNQGLATFNPSSACPTRPTERLSAPERHRKRQYSSDRPRGLARLPGLKLVLLPPPLPAIAGYLPVIGNPTSMCWGFVRAGVLSRSEISPDA